MEKLGLKEQPEREHRGHLADEYKPVIPDTEKGPQNETKGEIEANWKIKGSRE